MSSIDLAGAGAGAGIGYAITVFYTSLRGIGNGAVSLIIVPLFSLSCFLADPLLDSAEKGLVGFYSCWFSESFRIWEELRRTIGTDSLGLLFVLLFIRIF